MESAIRAGQAWAGRRGGVEASRPGGAPAAHERAIWKPPSHAPAYHLPADSKLRDRMTASKRPCLHPRESSPPVSSPPTRPPAPVVRVNGSTRGDVGAWSPAKLPTPPAFQVHGALQMG